MAKIIKLTPEYIEEVRKEFEESLNNLKLSDGKINFTKSFGSIDSKATVFYTDMAWQKMQTLIDKFDKEVAWHGVAYRDEDPEKNEYIITDILVYPQEVTGATVNTDQVEYQTWLMSHDDEVFNNIRMQGHSHVNMSVSPSTVDLSLYERFLDQLDDTMFYIFLIYNKKGDKTYKIYDLAKNILFETSDVTVKVIRDFDIDEFLADAKSKVVTKTTYPATQYGATGKTYPTYPTYMGSYAKPSTSATPAAASSAAASSKVESEQDEEKRKGKRKNISARPANPAYPEKYGSAYDSKYDDYDYNSPFGYYDGHWH